MNERLRRYCHLSYACNAILMPLYRILRILHTTKFLVSDAKTTTVTRCQSYTKHTRANINKIYIFVQRKRLLSIHPWYGNLIGNMVLLQFISSFFSLSLSFSAKRKVGIDIGIKYQHIHIYSLVFVEAWFVARFSRLRHQANETK